MTRIFDDPDGPLQDGWKEPAPESAARPPGVAGPALPRILVVDTDRALLGLLEEWLAACGCEVVSDQNHDGALDAPQTPFTLVIVDVPHPRRGGGELLQRIAHQHPGTPILALSSTFFSGIESTGAVARALGAACVLPKPVARESLIAAVQNLLPR